MDERLLKRMAVQSFGLMLMVIIAALIISQNNNAMIYADNTANVSNLDDKGLGSQPDNDDSVSGLLPAEIDNKPTAQIIGSKYIIIKKSNLTYYNVKLDDLYMDRSISLSFQGAENIAPESISFIRGNSGETYYGYPELIGDDNAGDNKTEDNNTEKNNSGDNKTEDNNTENNNSGGNNTGNNRVDNTGDDSTGNGNVGNNNTGNNNTRDNTELKKDVTGDPVESVHFDYTKDAGGNPVTNVLIQLDSIYVSKLYEDADNIYIDLRKPKDVYDKVIVVDAGHGGTDPGTYSEDEQYYEKDINLSIVLYLKELLDQEDIKVYYTRTTDKAVFLNPRVNLANDVQADFFISIHCNGNEVSYPSGVEVLYNENVRSKGLQSKKLAQLCLDEVSKVTNRINRGLVTGEDVVIIHKAKMPVSLIEVGFMSNKEELNFLLEDSNKKAIAYGIYKAILSAYAEYEQR